MLPGIGGFEYLLIAILALVVIGPKDLPMLMRKAGAFLNRLRGMAAEFRASFDEMARQSELDDLRKQVEELRSGQLMQPITSEIAPAMTEIETDIRAGTSIDWSGMDAAPVEEPDTQAPPTATRKPRTRSAAKAANGAKPAAAKPARAAAAAPSKPARKPAAKGAPVKAAPVKAAPAKARTKSKAKAAPRGAKA